MLTRLDENLWTAAAPLSFAGLRLGTRMTVVRQKSGGLFVHSAIALSPELKQEIDALGPVEHIVAPNAYHNIWAGEWKSAYPDATLHGGLGVKKRRPDLALDRELSDADWQDEIRAVHVDGTMLDETVFFHAPSRTLLAADFLENFTSKRGHWPTDVYLRLGGILGTPTVTRFLRPMYRDRKAARRSLERILEWEFDRITVCHGEVLEAGGKEALRQGYTWLVR